MAARPTVTSRRRGSRIHAGVRALAAAAALAVLIGGVPLIVADTLGSPVPGLQELAVGDMSDHAVVAVLAVVTLLAWAQFTLAALVQAFCLLANVSIPRRIPLVLPSQQHAARILVTAALVLIPAVSSVTGAPTAHAAGVPTAAGPTATAVLSTSAFTSMSTHLAHTSTTEPAHRPPAATSKTGSSPAWTHIVSAEGPGTYWDLAHTYLGTGERWHEIWDLNEGRQQADGTVMTSAHLLRPGWTVLIPSHPGAAPRGSVIVHAGDTLSGIAGDQHTSTEELWHLNRGQHEPGGTFSDPDHIEPGWHLRTPSTHTSTPRRSHPAPAAPAPGGHASTPAHDDAPAPDQAPLGTPASHGAGAPSAGSNDDSGDHDPVPAHRATPPASTGSPAESSQTDARTPAAPSAAAPVPTSTPAREPAQAPDEDAARPGGSHASSASVLMHHGLGPGAGLLAASALIALIRHRRRQFRHRRPGHTITATPGALVSMEKALLSQGSTAMTDLTWLDQALRDLADQVARSGMRLPDISAARMGPGIIELLPATPPDPETLVGLSGSHPGAAFTPGPWRIDAGTGRWQLRRQDHLREPSRQGDLPRHQLAPYPGLVSIGYSDQGDYWLLDLEKIGALRLVGDRARCLDLARFIGAELAHNTWSEQLEVTLVGVGGEVEAINPQRLTYTEDPTRALAGLQTQCATNAQIMHSSGLPDALHGRQDDIIADQWMPHVLIIDPETDPAAAPQIDDLLSTLGTQPGRSAVALVVAGPGGQDETGTEAHPGWQLSLDESATVHIPGLGLHLHAQQLPAGEATQLADLLSCAADTQDDGTPPARGDAAWDALADAAGAPLQELTVASASAPAAARRRPRDDAAATIAAPVSSPINAPGPRVRLAASTAGASDPAAVNIRAPQEVQQMLFGEPEGEATHPQPDARLHVEDSTTPGVVLLGAQQHAQQTSSVLPQAMDNLLAATATTARDVQTLSPRVNGTSRRRVEDADPALDSDLAAWHAPDTIRPRLSLLGPIQVRSSGSLPGDRPRPAWNTEIVAYLAAHPRGVPAEQFATDLWPDDPNITSKSKPRQAVHLARRWLGKDPLTSQPYLPAAVTSPAGLYLYRVEGLLIDADLFRRLRLRGVARGIDGMGDLQAALGLVTGKPFDQRRPGGYAWLADVPLDHEYLGMIVDVAHLVATHHLATGHPQAAADAAQVSLLAGSFDDIPLLDLVAACDAQGNHAEASSWIARILTTHDAEVEEDLPPRTAEILHRRQWNRAS